jgi:hypothetical protein
MKSDVVKTGIKERNMKSHGVEWLLSSPSIQEKIQLTWESRGYKRNSSTKDWLDSVKATNNKKWGVDFPIQNSEFFDNQLKSLYKRKEYLLPSGKIIFIQGFENMAIDELLTIYKENDIVIGAKQIEDFTGKIFYEIDNKKRRYFPDIFLLPLNTIIEVKSDYTFLKQKQQNIAKMNSSIALGFNFKFIIYGKQSRFTWRPDEGLVRESF